LVVTLQEIEITGYLIKLVCVEGCLGAGVQGPAGM